MNTTRGMYERRPDEEQTMAEAGKTWVDALHGNAIWLVALGVFEVLIGAAAIFVPFLAGIAATVVIGGMLLVGGIARVIRMFRAQTFGQGIWALVGGLLAVLVGLIMLSRPLIGLGSLTLLLGGYFFVQGVSSLVLSFRTRPHRASGWLLVDGIITVLLALIIVSGWPLSGLWAIGTLVGIDLLITGAASISIGSAARRQLDWSGHRL